MNVHQSVGDLIAYVATAIQEKRPIDPKLAKYALDILEGRFVPLAKGMHACATGFPEVCDVAFDFAGIPTWIARDKDGSAFAFRGFGPDGGPGSLIETPKGWHIELVHGIENDVPVVAWPKTGGEVFDIRWSECHCTVVNIGPWQDRPAFVLWKDDRDRRFAAVFGTHDGRIVCLDDQSLDQYLNLGAHRLVTEVVERGGRAWIFAHNFRTNLHEIIDDQGETLGTGQENAVDVVVHGGKPVLVKVNAIASISVGIRHFEHTCAWHPHETARIHVLNGGSAVALINHETNGIDDALAGVHYGKTGAAVHEHYSMAATNDRLFYAGRCQAESADLQVFDRESGDRLTSASGVRTHDTFRQFGDDMCVAFENGNWRVYYGADDTEWDTGIPSTERIQLLPNHRAATWKFVDGTLYTRVTSSRP